MILLKSGGKLCFYALKRSHKSANSIAADLSSSFLTGKDEDVAMAEEGIFGFDIWHIAAFHEGREILEVSGESQRQGELLYAEISLQFWFVVAGFFGEGLLFYGLKLPFQGER